LDKKNDGGYEGAIVLPPKCGLYLDEPVACVDYSSLYPSSMISENLSHDSKVWSLEYDLEGKLVSETGIKDQTGKYIYDNLEKYEYVDIEYDTYDYIRKTPSGAAIKTLVGYKKCRFAQFPDGELAIMPKILKELLSARKSTRTSAKWKTIEFNNGGENVSGLVIEKTDTQTTIKDKNGKLIVFENETIKCVNDTYSNFMKNVLDKRQLAIKLTANSLYGQCGARTSSFYEKDVAASTTAIGRKLLTYGKRIIEEVYGDRICTTKYGTVKSNAEYIYGDTDSVFMSFKLTDIDTGKNIVGKEALKHTIELAKEAGELATKFLKAPHDLEYEKTFMPFCLLSKKRYVGMLYEEDVDKCFRKSMGIVLKRRDNAPIVKDVYGGIIDILMKDQDVSKAISFTKKYLNDIVDEKYPLDKLIITKSLRAFYKNPRQIAHKVLADRIGKRDPGNKPGAGDRVPFVYIQTKKDMKLQGDRIKTPEYIVKNNLKPDYTHYITNQIMKPVQQVFALVLQDIPEYKSKKRMLVIKEKGIMRKYIGDDTKQNKYIQDHRNKEVKGLIFDDALRKCNLRKNNQQSLKSFFGQ
jgi:DNA polymerase elongation subunit (family B)